MIRDIFYCKKTRFGDKECHVQQAYIPSLKNRHIKCYRHALDEFSCVD